TWQAVDHAMIGLRKNVTSAQRREVREYLLSMGPHSKQAYKNLIAFKNGVLDLATGELRSMAKSDRIINVVPHDFVPSAKSDVVEGFLDSISAGEAGMRDNLEEIAGLCLYRNAGVGLAAFLVGNGANGKSVYIEALKNLAGEDNYSFLDPQDLSRNAFQRAALAGKTANFCDDLSIDAMTRSEVSTFKRVVTGGEVPAEVKYGAAFSFAPTAFHAFAGNKMPRFLDHTKGLERRLHIVVFKATFMPGTPGFDPDMSEKLQTEGAAQALAVLAVRGLRRALAQNALTKTEHGEESLEEVRRENRPVYRWCMEEVARADLAGKSVQEAYDEYSEWSRDEGLGGRPSRRNFAHEVTDVLDLRTANNGWDAQLKQKFRTFEVPKI
ncbi:DNA primase family protein, partial [Gordonibacter sp.]|uniref:DNA primase family protein n=1 Tax=Gordonibacter sp. TaxID=1968902 RepID=UPI002FC6BFEE